jgi:hypothetical protein
MVRLPHSCVRLGARRLGVRRQQATRQRDPQRACHFWAQWNASVATTMDRLMDAKWPFVYFTGLWPAF